MIKAFSSTNIIKSGISLAKSLKHSQLAPKDRNKASKRSGLKKFCTIRRQLSRKILIAKILNNELPTLFRELSKKIDKNGDKDS